MKIIVTGSLGNISKPLAKQLVANGHDVNVISSDTNKVNDIEALGAKAAIGSIADVDFLAQTFTGADVVYTMIPPNFAAANYRKYVGDSGKTYAEAVKKAGIKRIVNLSSIGADIDGGTGPISGVHDAETGLNKLEGVAIKHVRAGFFYTNFYNNIPMINQGFLGSNYSAQTRLVMTHPLDIANIVAEELQNTFTGKSVRYAVSDERTLGEAAKILGAAIDKPDLKWIEFTDEQAYEGMLQGGLPPEIARNFTEMGTAIRSAILWKDFDASGGVISGKIKLEEFAKEFAERLQVTA
ncbi:NAD(P)H-binding protein [Mucilaginibacter sp. BT774]|uniref:NAD(P)H-binding protein n=1 Tax=Mucilaginibacter sp. BT774 TaxID=3062276 RepID=UPI002675B3FA|nr:NAD(P)H-binding protein [Mucilaginibacter sp. BT774]MDO3625713.1 NAD(P)H-binding protein [Mucilaginibacter sp. BT774]